MTTLAAAVPVLPVTDTRRAAAFYDARLGFRTGHVDDSYAVTLRDAVEIHLWAATDTRWRERGGDRPVVSGAESFLAGTASARIFVDAIDPLFEEMRAAGVLHPAGGPTDRDYGFREFAVLDLDGNLITFFARL